jgi:hypothetical protein
MRVLDSHLVVGRCGLRCDLRQATAYFSIIRSIPRCTTRWRDHLEQSFDIIAGADRSREVGYIQRLTAGQRQCFLERACSCERLTSGRTFRGFAAVGQRTPFRDHWDEASIPTADVPLLRTRISGLESDQGSVVKQT